MTKQLPKWIESPNFKPNSNRFAVKSESRLYSKNSLLYKAVLLRAVVLNPPRLFAKSSLNMAIVEVTQRGSSKNLEKPILCRNRANPGKGRGKGKPRSSC
jgi:hypothetical protein